MSFNPYCSDLDYKYVKYLDHANKSNEQYFLRLKYLLRDCFLEDGKYFNTDLAKEVEEYLPTLLTDNAKKTMKEFFKLFGKYC